MLKSQPRCRNYFSDIFTSLHLFTVRSCFIKKGMSIIMNNIFLNIFLINWCNISPDSWLQETHFMKKKCSKFVLFHWKTPLPKKMNAFRIELQRSHSSSCQNFLMLLRKYRLSPCNFPNTELLRSHSDSCQHFLFRQINVVENFFWQSYF